MKKLREATKRFMIHHSGDIQSTSNTFFTVAAFDTVNGFVIRQEQLAETNSARTSCECKSITFGYVELMA